VSVLKRKGFVAKVEFDGQDEIFVGTVLGIDDVIGFHGDSVDMLKKAFRIALDDYVATCRKLGRAPQRSHSGELRIRIAAKTHLAAAVAAQARGMSLNGWIEEAMRRMARVDVGEG
jgi:predicted HicB family RNase H-like nuclease